VTIVALAAAVALAAYGVRGPESPHRTTLAASAATGGVSIANSREGAAVFTARGMVPGREGTGEVTMTNAGAGAATVALSKSQLSEIAGVGGGRLSARLQLRIADVTGGGSTVVYSGALVGMTDQLLGRFQPGEAHTYRFTTVLPGGGAGGADNAFGGASLSVEFDWFGEGVGDAPPAEGPAEGSPPESQPPSGNGAARPTVTVAARPKVRSKRSKRRYDTGVNVTCPAGGGSCRATGELRASSRARKSRRLAKVKLTVSAERTVRVSIPLSRKSLKSVRGARKLRFMVTVSDPGGGPAVRRTLRLR
jgi:hypothetical protein